ncbi:MAG: FecR domain-containing protein [Bacteroidota bacterium]
MAEEHIHDLVAKVLSGGATEAEARALREWAEADPAHADQLAAWRATWERIPLPQYDHPIDVDAAWTKVAQRIDATPVRSLRGPAWWGLRIAAAVILLVVAGYFLLRPDTPQVLQFASLNTPKTVELPDGSTVYLDQQSQLTYQAGEARVLRLQGKAFFEVSRDEAHPFVIDAKGSKVEVLGTSFSVDARPEVDSLSVRVATGLVAFSQNANRIELEPGTKGVLLAGSGVPVKKTDPEAGYADWAGDFYFYNATPLSNVLAQLAQIHGLQLGGRMQDLGNCRFTGKIIGQDLNAALETLELTTGLDLDTTDEELRLISGSCE